jgi:hypothetical protein
VEPAQQPQELDLVVGRVTAADVHRGARGPSALLDLDLGPRGTAQAPVPFAVEDAEALVGTQVVCNVGRDDVAVLAARPHAGVVLLHPAREVEDGSPVA